MNFLPSLREAMIKAFAAQYQQIYLWHFIAFAYGSAISTSINLNLVKIFILITCALAFYCLLEKHNGRKQLALITFFFTLGITIGCAKERYFKQASPITKPTICYIEGVIAQINKLHHGTKIMLKHSQLLYSTQAKDLILPGYVRLKISDKYFSKLSAGDKILLEASLAPAPQKLMPEGYDFNFYASIDQISAVGFALSKPIIISRSDDFFRNLQEKIYHRLIQTIPSIAANFISALVIGVKDGLDQEVMQNIRLAGISHLLCISGLHLSLVTMLCFNLFRFLLNASDYLAYRINIKLIAGALSICCSCFYLLLSGCQVSATRAFIMSGLTSLAIILQRDYSPIRALGLASMVILAITPGYALHPSFQLSFMAVLSLLAMQDMFNLSASKSSFFLGKVKNWLLLNLYSSNFVGFATAPIVAHHFHIFSNFSAIANLIAIPITTFILMPCSILFMLLMPFGLDKYILLFMSYWIEPIIKIAQMVAKLPYNTVHTGYVESRWLGMYLFGFFWLVIWQSRLRLFGLLIIVSSILLALNTKKPEIVVDLNSSVLAKLNKQSQVEIFSYDKISKFALQYWALWFGQEKVARHILANSALQKITMQNGCAVNFTFNRQPKSTIFDLQINCPQQQFQQQIIRNLDQQTTGRFLFLYPKSQGCKISFYD